MAVKIKKRRRRPKEEYVHYVATISGWEHMFGFSVGKHSRYEREPYSEFGSLTLRGMMVRPEECKYPKAEFTIHSKRGMFDGEWDTLPKSIGTLYADGDLLRIAIFVPVERMAELLTMAASERVQAVAFVGTKLKWRQGSVHNIELMTEFIEEDW